MSAPSPRAIRRCPRTCAACWSAATARARRASLARRKPSKTWAGILVTRFTRRRSTIWSTRSGRAAPRTCYGVAPSAVCTSTPGSATPSRLTCASSTAASPAVVHMSMQPLATLPHAVRRAFRGVLTDIDDTLSTHGRITPTAYAALARLRAAGLLVIPITGRPAGWCDHIARMWPVDAIVGENRALYMIHDDREGRLRKHYAATTTDPNVARVRLPRIAETMLHEVPCSALTSDPFYSE